MAQVFCVICQQKVESSASKHRTWRVNGLKREGWGCEKHWNHMAENIELVPEKTREERVQYAGDQIQSQRQGEWSKEWIERYPDKVNGMVRQGILTEKEVKGAKDVWKKDMKGL
jgi:hypothetical protein